MKLDLGRRAAAEFVGTFFLLAAVVGSGVMAERLSGGNVALALLANAIATGAALVAILLALGSVSGAHLNPVVTVAEAWRGGLVWRDAAAYVVAQMMGALAGVAAAHGMFGLAVFSVSTHARSGGGQMLSEGIATFGLLVVILGCAKSRPEATPFAVGAYISAAYWFTASTSFANPVVTIARALTNSFSGIRPVDVPGFLLAQVMGGVCASIFFKWLLPSS